MKNRQWNCLRRVLGVLLLACFMASAPRTALAEKTDYKDKDYDFSRVRRVLVYDVDLSVPDFSSSMKAQKYRQDFMDYTKKMGCEVLNEDQARRRISLAIGVDLDALAKTDPDKANQLFNDNLSTAVDAWIKSRVLKWENTYYIEPERTVWEQKRIDRSYRDGRGNWHDDYYYVTVPVTYPPRRVDVSTLNMSFEVHDVKTGKMIFGREDDRDRNDYDAQDGMYERICKSFFSDFGNKIH